MSGILGLVNIDGAPVRARELCDMASLLTRRGPERTGLWHEGAVGLGHTLLATTPEMLLEELPLAHAGSGCVITGDIRLDNRDELLVELGLRDRAAVTGDGGLVLAAYLEWGEGCVERFLGDFAFAIWDPRTRTLFCARDHFGIRHLLYHHAPGGFLAFATEPRAILVLPQVPYRLNEARIGDYLVGDWALEGVNYTSTFFEEVSRLPPAHVLSVTSAGVTRRRYWELRPGTELRLPSNDAYAEALLDVFTEAVRSRLRTAGPVGSMLSGGLDSGSVTAVAARLLAEEGRGPLHTFSAISPDGDADPETRAISAALALPGIEPITVSHGELGDLLPSLREHTWQVDEPFDGHMTLMRAMYLAARRQGITSLLDGGGGDLVLSEGSYLVRLLRARRWATAYREARGLSRFYKGAYSTPWELARAARGAFVPDPVRRRVAPLRRRARARRVTGASVASADFAAQLRLVDRYGAVERSGRPRAPGAVQRAATITHPSQTAVFERYERVAASAGVEPRDPFIDRRVVELCVRLPDSQLLRDGWPKVILRRAMSGVLPDAVVWRTGKEHLGWAFTQSLLRHIPDRRQRLEAAAALLDPYVDQRVARAILRPALGDDGPSEEESYNLLYLASWLERNADRPGSAHRGKTS